MLFTKYGRRELLLFGGVAAALMAVVLVLTLRTFQVPVALLISLPFVALFGWVLSFFRNPRRVPPEGELRLVAPADGVVSDIGEVDEPLFLGEKALRIGIFLSVFNCHVNRAPCSGTVEKIVYRKGSFHSALKTEHCSEHNESNFIGLADAAGKDLRIGVRQIAGQIARRIVCELDEGSTIERGQPFGMIKFGSRTELFVPVSAAFTLGVKLGQPVRAGQTIMGTLE